MAGTKEGGRLEDSEGGTHGGGGGIDSLYKSRTDESEKNKKFIWG